MVEDSEAEVCYYRMDVIWNYMKSIQDSNGIFCFQMLSHIALLVLTLPHSNAAEERVFSLINKNKTKFRPSLKLDGTLSTLKLANTVPCHLFEPDDKIVQDAKKLPCCTIKNTVMLLNKFIFFNENFSETNHVSLIIIVISLIT